MTDQDIVNHLDPDKWQCTICKEWKTKEKNYAFMNESNVCKLCSRTRMNRRRRYYYNGSSRYS